MKRRIIGKQRRVGGTAHIIQACITVVDNKHACIVCGNDAYLCITGYEVITEDDEDSLSMWFKQFKSREEAVAMADKAPTTTTIYKATIEEQRRIGPVEHTKDYYCFPCASTLIDMMMGKPTQALTALMGYPRNYALWVVHHLIENTPVIFNGSSHEPQIVLQALKYTTLRSPNQ